MDGGRYSIRASAASAIRHTSTLPPTRCTRTTDHAATRRTLPARHRDSATTQRLPAPPHSRKWKDVSGRRRSRRSSAGGFALATVTPAAMVWVTSLHEMQDIGVGVALVCRIRCCKRSNGVSADRRAVHTSVARCCSGRLSGLVSWRDFVARVRSATRAFATVEGVLAHAGTRRRGEGAEKHLFETACRRRANRTRDESSARGAVSKALAFGTSPASPRLSVSQEAFHDLRGEKCAVR